MQLFPEGHRQKWWPEFLSFLWDGGARSLIVVILILGATGITIGNKYVCAGSPSTTPSNNGTPTPLVQPNPICSKYFELVSLVIGGYLGLSLPKSGAKEKDSASAPEPPVPEPVPVPPVLALIPLEAEPEPEPPVPEPLTTENSGDSGTPGI